MSGTASSVSVNAPYTISSIRDAQYTVTIDLYEWLCGEQIMDFMDKIKAIKEEDPWLKQICSAYGAILEYKSESLFPEIDDTNKKKVLLIFGNPATHSVTKGMFFFSTGKGERHTKWEKLEKAELIHEVRCGTLKEEAEARKEMILNGILSDDYLFGLTTFYSFPTPVVGEFKDVAGLRRLFKPMRKQLEDMECKRLNDYIVNYSFVKDAVWVFNEAKSHRCADKKLQKKFKYWPGRGKGSGGDDLKKILEDC